jgi:predicted Zn-dependent protease
MRMLLRGLSVAAVALLASCQTWRNLNIYNAAEQQSMGEDAFAEALKDTKHPSIESGAEHDRVVRVGRKIAAAAGKEHDPNYNWEFKLLRADDVPNAFCLPGGKVAVYSGILPLAQNEDGLAAVLGHEVAHATLEHGAKRMTQGLVLNIGLAVAAAGVSMSKMTNEQKLGVVAALGAGTQLGLVLPFSREDESDADVMGIRYAIRAGYDPWEAPKLWERMAQLGDAGPTWLSTHPDPLARAEKLREVIPQILAEERPGTPTTPPSDTKDQKPKQITPPKAPAGKKGAKSPGKQPLP